MKVEDYKQKIASLQWQDYVDAQLLRDYNASVKAVKISIEIIFLSGVCDKIVKTKEITIHPCDKLYVHEDCPNDKCTGKGFSLTNEIRKAIAENKSHIEGMKCCDGKEDEKYFNSNNNTCNTTFRYAVDIER